MMVNDGQYMLMWLMMVNDGQYMLMMVNDG